MPIGPAGRGITGGATALPAASRAFVRQQALLGPARIPEPDALGMIWPKNANARERGHAYAKAFRRMRGGSVVR
ncbi:hypothetical protein ACH4E7_41955 [Kitasatospora sp. NPDC018058]|uniref:hypothetical protein n=1 Tax=Kitasatospora sp. NPDC018058 TaxID=3364025 RepID=UPI0037C0D761